MSIAVAFYLRNEEEKLISSVSFSGINLGLCDICPNVLYSLLLQYLLLLFIFITIICIIFI